MCGEQECAAIEEVEHDSDVASHAAVSRPVKDSSRITASPGHSSAGNLDATALPIPHISPLRETAMPRPRKCTNGALFKLCGQ